MEHTFGGDWTEEKLACLRKYLSAYRAIFESNDRARYFRTWYVDAFAGTGARTQASTPQHKGFFDDVYEETSSYRDGSARIALQLEKPFHQYLFIEASDAKAEALRENVSTDFSALLPRCSFEVGDANQVLQDWCLTRDWKKERAVVFLDPYGMQVDWTTIEALGKTKAVDLWYLFPLGVGASRLMPHDGKVPDGWRKRLNALFGTADWEDRFYRRHEQAGFFYDEEIVERDAPAEKIGAFIEERLATCFSKVAKGLILRNSKSSPLYMLCFAAANVKGAPTALRIAQNILAG